MRIEKLESTLSKIWSKELLHDQSVYENETACGTSRCLAGWICYLYGGKEGLKSNECPDWEEKANEIIGTSIAEGYLLYHPYANKKIHEAVLSALKMGKRLILSEEEIAYIGINFVEESNYLGDIAIKTVVDPNSTDPIPDQVEEKLRNFLGDFYWYKFV